MNTSGKLRGCLPTRCKVCCSLKFMCVGTSGPPCSWRALAGVGEGPMVLRYLTGEFELENGKLRREGTTQPRSADRLHEKQTVAMVFGGGLGLAAYHAG